MIQYIIAYIAAGVMFIIFDLVWLGIIGRDLYVSKLGNLMAQDVVIPAAVLFYLMYLTGIVLFAIHPAFLTGSWKTALIWGALFGFFCYATYELTNWAVIRDWPASLVLIDIVWGVVLTGAVATTAYLITKLFT